MRVGFALACLLTCVSAFAEPVPELRLLSEHPVEGMRGGNLSGLALCGKELWTVSDRDDDQIYRLQASDTVWQAQAVHIDVPPVPDSGLPWGLRSRTWAASFVRGATWISKASPVITPAIATLSARHMRPCCKCRQTAPRPG